MKEELIKYATAKLAKEKGFNIYQPTQYSRGVNPTTEYDYTEQQCNLFNDMYYAPTQSLLQKWLRDKFNINIFIDCEMNCSSVEYDWFKYKYKIYNNRKWINFGIYNGANSHEEALENGLLEALNLIN